MALPGLQENGLTFAPLDLGPETYSDLVRSTLGSSGENGDDLDLSTQALAALMSDFETDVSSSDAADTIPDVSKHVLDTGILKAIATEIAVASATELAVSDALDLLAASFGVSAAIDVLVSATIATFKPVIDVLINSIYFVLRILIFLPIGGL